METVPRPGVNDRWLKSWKTTVRNNDEWFRRQFPERLASLQQFVDHGLVPPPDELARHIQPVVPPKMGWESVDLDLGVFGALQAWTWEKAAIEDACWDEKSAVTAFSAIYLAEMVALYRHMLAARRLGKDMQVLSPRAVFFTALGFVIGIESRAGQLMRLQLAAYRKGYVSGVVVRPISAFVIRLLADYLGQPPLVFKGDPDHLLKGEVAADPVMQGLFAVWQDPVPAVLAPWCLAACDVHTHQSLSSARSHRLEFNSGLWRRTPIEMLLMFKLRRSLGLKNPEIEHPLMGSVLGRLPDGPAKCEPEEIVQRVEARMRADGFSEEQLLAGYKVA